MTQGVESAGWGRSVVLFPSRAVVRRELLTTVRQIRPFVWLVLLVGCCALAVWLTWPNAGFAVVQLLGAPQAQGLRQAPGMAAELSRELLRNLSFILMSGCLLIVPALAGGSIAVEREKDTLEQLSLTLIRPTGLLAAKLVNAAGLFVLMVLGAMPVVATVFFSVGLDWRELAAALILVLSAAVLSGAVGLMCSAFFRRPVVALIASYLGTIMINGGPFAFLRVLAMTIYMMIGTGNGMFRGARFRGAQYAVSPLKNLSALHFSDYSGYHLTVAVAGQMALAIMCLMLARCFLRRRAAMQVKVTGEKPIDDLSVLRKRRRTFPFYLVDPLRRKKAIPDRRNPMTAREVTWGIVRNASTLVRIFYLSLTFCAFGSLWIVLFREWQEGTMVWLAVEMGLVVFVAPALLCNAMAREYEQGNIDMIRMTLLSPRRIVMGKVAAGTLCLTPVLIAALMSCVPILIFGSEARLMVVKGMTTMFVCALVSLGLGICVSMLSNRTVTAIVLGYLATVALFFALPFGLRIAGEILEELGGASFNSAGAWGPLAFLSPITAFIYDADQSSSAPLTGYWFRNIVLFTVAGFALIELSVRMFASRRMRDK